ncbi:MAG: exo-alpha-sialidase [Verrucomicrobiota bacterium]|nr:exo-alpha-sialidase [Verrucomicrobiota bacterium]
MDDGGILSLNTWWAVWPALAAGLCLAARTGAATEWLPVQAAGFTLATNKALTDGTNLAVLSLNSSHSALPFCQSAIKQSTAPARQGPDPKIPYFTVRFALPIPPENMDGNFAALTGMDPAVFTHNHSPGFEILPNGDALAVWFSTPPGQSESATTTTFVQARLRYGAEEWDMPKLFLDFKNRNDQSGLLWRDGNKTWFFGGGGGGSPQIPFKVATTTDNGATWTLSLPLLDRPAADFTPQPITSAFRAPDGAIYFAMDGVKATSFLWRSADDGIHWEQMKGRTGGRHSAVAPLDGRGDLLSIGGKNSSADGWSPENVSTNWGATWSRSKPSPFPPLGSGQRPGLIRLADGSLFFVSDAWLQKARRPPPAGWKFGDGCFVAISTNDGASWRIKLLPVQLPHHQFRKFGTVGYVVARQAPNGVIHVLTTETQPCLDYELNEAWIFSEKGDIAPEHHGGVLRRYRENYAGGSPRAEWGARICPHGRYLLDGLETDYYPDGRKEHVVTYRNGLKAGMETFWEPDGVRLWSWNHDLKAHRSVWIHYWPNGRKRIESTWDTRPRARDLDRSFFGLVANGPVYQWKEDGQPVFAGDFANGAFVGTRPLPPPQP